MLLSATVFHLRYRWDFNQSGEDRDDFEARLPRHVRFLYRRVESRDDDFQSGGTCNRPKPGWGQVVKGESERADDGQMTRTAGDHSKRMWKQRSWIWLGAPTCKSLSYFIHSAISMTRVGATEGGGFPGPTTSRVVLPSPGCGHHSTVWWASRMLPGFYHPFQAAAIIQFLRI